MAKLINSLSSYPGSLISDSSGSAPLASRALSSAKISVDALSPSANLLLILIFLIDLVGPFLIWKGFLPASARWISDLALVVVLGILFCRMFVFDQFPLGFWLLSGFTILGMTQATLHGQSPMATIWGWWQTLSVPTLVIYAYLNPHWPKNFSHRLYQTCFGILAIQLVIQLFQYATGEAIGDNLAGSFGFRGVSELLIFSVFTISLTLGHGVAKSEWRPFLIAFAIGIVSSVLAENKIFPVAVLLLTIMAVGLTIFLGGKLLKLVPYAVLFGLGLILFFVGYNAFVPAAEKRTLEQFIYDQELRESYNQHVRTVASDQADFRIGRDFALEHGWNFIRTHGDSTVFVFGLGLGARSESKSLGAVGIALEQDGLGLVRGTGIMNLLHEMGLMGIAVVSLFIVVLTYLLLRDMRLYRTSIATELRAALLMFTLLWPLLLWYKPFWWFRVSMLLYWVALGYVFHQRRHDQLALAAPANGNVVSPPT